ncbi:MAG: trypsin-like serine protease [Ruminococcaceae bacterium]|nr:trypsin-like serine protease [Oscillospiraceae bacterium]
MSDINRNDSFENKNDVNANIDSAEAAGERENVYTADSDGYSMHGRGDSEWVSVHSAESAGQPDGSGGQKKPPLSPLSAVLLSVSVLLICTAVLLVTFMTIGQRRENDGETSAESEWESVSIDDGVTTEASNSDGTQTDMAEALGTLGTDTQASVEWQTDVDFPDKATIIKTKPLRADKNSDGRADVETDAAGNVLTSAAGNVNTVATVVNNVADSVVEIRTETVTNSSWVGQYVMTGAGSGVIISKEGYIVTNNHVIEDADNIIVRMTDGSEHAAYLVGSDADTDIAVIWIDPDGITLTVAELGCSFDLVVGEDIIAIGNPLGSLGGTVTDGIVSATARNITIDGTPMTLLQISAPINPGNSGGGLFNRAGQLVGVVNAKCSSEEVEGLGFAIPIDTAYDVISELIEYRYIRGKASAGLDVVDVTSSQTAMMYFGSRYVGAYVYSSEYTDGLAYGDLIISVDGVEVSTSDDINDILRDMSVGDKVTVSAYRSSTNEQFEVEITLGEYIPEYLEAAA